MCLFPRREGVCKQWDLIFGSVEVAREKAARIERDWYFANERPIARLGANARAEFAVFELSR